MIGLVALTVATVSIDPGVQPTWEQAVQLGNQAILSRLVDPDSARIAWPYRFVGGSLKSLFGKTQTGWYTCGSVNARNRMGGYTGDVPFLILIRDGSVQSLDIGTTDGLDTATVTCKKLAKKGFLQASGAPATPTPFSATSATETLEALQAAGAAAAQAAVTQGGIGISFLSTPAGLVIMAVAPDSPAATAGLKAGQVIQSANGIDMKGMPQPAALSVLHGLPKDIDFVIAGTGEVKLLRSLIVSRPRPHSRRGSTRTP